MNWKCVFLSSLAPCGSCGVFKNLRLVFHPFRSTCMKKHCQNRLCRPDSSNHVDTVAKKKGEKQFGRSILILFFAWGPFIYYVSTCGGGGGVRKCQFLLILNTKNMLT